MQHVVKVPTEGVEAGESAPPSGRVLGRREDFFALVPCAAFWLYFVWRSSWVANGRRQFTLFDDAMVSI